jgi:hypothetical protein
MLHGHARATSREIADTVWDAKVSEIVKSDFNRVRHLALVALYGKHVRIQMPCGSIYPESLEACKGCFLVNGGTDERQADRYSSEPSVLSTTPRNVVFNDYLPLDDANYDLYSWDFDAAAAERSRAYAKLVLIQTQMQKWALQTRIVEADRITNIPGDNCARDAGEPYVCIALPFI